MKKSYIIDYTKCLGRGATADVYLGMKITDGSQYAMKCSRTYLRKEISILKELNHQNIVKFYESFDKFEMFQQVIVMEYCNNGSLYDFIEMHRGLCDNMFLQTLECLHQGINYLRSLEYVHRDIKPGNMMVHQDPLGYYHVKLGDMGAAKRVEDSQTFQTLVGTEEYLHPDMYIRYLENFTRSHKANTDLWSIGVTLYHAAVAQLPFLPFNYSRNSEQSKDTLKHMYTIKKPGIICGRQNSNSKNDITWSSQLPDCRLSPMLSEMASLLLGKLMDQSESNTYERFFEDANKILQKKRCLMFNSSDGQLQMLYLDNLTYNNIIEEVGRRLNLSKDDFVVITKSKRLEQLADIQAECLRSVPVKGHMRYELNDDTILIVPVKASEPIKQLFTQQCNTNCELPPSVYRNFKLSRKYAEDLMKSIYQITNIAKYIDCQIECYKSVVNSFNDNVMVDSLKTMNTSITWQMKAIKDCCLMTDSLVKIANLALLDSEGNQINQDSLLKCKEEIEQLRIKANEGEKCGEQYFHKIVENREMIKYTRKLFNDDDTRDSKIEDSLDVLIHLSEELVNEVKLVPEEKLSTEDYFKLEIWQRHMRQFSFFQTAKERLEMKSKRIKSLHTSFHSWTKQAHNVMNRISMLRDFLKRQEERRLSLRTKFLQIHEYLERIIPNLNIGERSQLTLSVSGNDALKAKIFEIKTLTEATKNLVLQDPM